MDGGVLKAVRRVPPVVQWAVLVVLVLGTSCSTDAAGVEQASGPTSRSLPGSAPTPKPRVTPQELCTGPHAIDVDVDGDGRLDRAYHAYVEDALGEDLDGARLGVCTAAGDVDEIDGAGQAEGDFRGVDLAADGRSELLYGATTATEQLAALAVFRAGRLHAVTAADGQDFILADGWRNETTGSAWGCQRANDGRSDLVQVVVNQHGGTAEWTRDVYRLSETIVTHLGATTGKEPKRGYPHEQAAALVEAC